MELTRRFVIGSGAAAAAGFAALPAIAASLTDDAIEALTGGAKMGESAITLTTPEIAENGNTVPIGFDAPGAVEVTIYADGNPLPEVATFKFGKMAAERSATTRIRLAGTQNIVAVAKMEDGSFQMAKNNVKVTIGGCGG